MVVVPGIECADIAWFGPVPADRAAAFQPVEIARLTAGKAAGGPVIEPLRDHGRPSLRGHRLAAAGTEPAAGLDWTPKFRLDGFTTSATTGRIVLVDPVAGLRLETEIEAVVGGAIRVRHGLTNTGATPYVVDGLEATAPVPSCATELLDFTGGWGDERAPQRRPITTGLTVREARQGKPGNDSAFCLLAGTPGFGFGHGALWAVHLAWSGNGVYYLQRDALNGLTRIAAGELLLPGEVVLATDETYVSPWVYFAASEHGLDGVAHQFHRHLRSQSDHPANPRLVHFNGWDAVGFDLNEQELFELADLAAKVGAERYVLDDGWFGGRRHDRAGLGDWVVSPDALPRGLDPLIGHVNRLGMQFGLWFESEMINEDSDLYRRHPEWVLAPHGRLPDRERNQLVLDITHPGAFSHILERMDGLLSRHNISYVKWDHNRSLRDAGILRHGGVPAAHHQTSAFYRLLDVLRQRHPTVEWETCSGGGGRVDLGVLSRAERLWPSDNTDAQSRQLIQRWTGQLVPPEYVGCHISQPVSKHTGRLMSLRMRAVTAMFGNFGIEWNLLEADGHELAELAEWTAVYKEHRQFLHAGKVVRLDTPDESVIMHGVVADDGSEAIFAAVWLATTAEAAHRPLRLRPRGLAPDRWFQAVEIWPVVPRPEDAASRTAAGAVLEQVGYPIHHLQPLNPVVIRFTMADEARLTRL